jgi:antitoxin CptB
MREMDLILGRFVNAQIASLSESELEDLERLLEAHDQDVFSWLTGEAKVPNPHDTPVFRKILAFHSIAPIHT